MIDSHSRAAPNFTYRNVRNIGYWLALAAIVALGAWLRLGSLDDHSLTQDETSMLQFTRGVLEYGYPRFKRGETVIPMKTYELVPYFIAASIKLFGWSEWAVRLPAALFGIGTLILLAVAGRRWFNGVVALWAAALYAISPWAIYWGQNCFYPSQLQFFALLSLLFVHNVLTSDQPRPGSYWLAALCLGITYLSWEGIGLMFVVLGTMAIGLRWRRWDFLYSRSAWLALGSLGLLIVLQLVRRALFRDPYLLVGSSLSSISSPQLAMLESSYNPSFYLETVFASEQMLVLSVFFLVGLWYLRRDWNLRFVYAYVILMAVVYTELLPEQSIRYIYSVLPLFLLGTAAASVRVVAWTRGASSATAPFSGRWLVLGVGTLMLGMQAATLSENGLTLSGLSRQFQVLRHRELGGDVAAVDYRAVMLALQRRFRPGDIVVVRAPFPLHAYTGMKGDFYLQKFARVAVFYEPDADSAQYTDKWFGKPVLRNLTELKDLLYKHERVWLVAAPYGVSRQLMGKDTYEFVSRNMSLELEGQNVRLYLWEQS